MKSLTGLILLTCLFFQDDGLALQSENLGLEREVRSKAGEKA
jgi:hypothetical protein